ncbi:MAG: hypothetical protein LBM56_02480 [Burkholderiaceae bacterium]|jgi:hypothetical protein|nr:hypothetical protein [Burkholderiaceae bacterium]
MEHKMDGTGNLQELLQNMASDNFVYLSEIESDLLQIDLLFRDAVSKLGNNVVGIGKDVRRQQQIVRQLMETGSCSPYALERLGKLGEEMDDNVAAVVTAMQFQDMSSQLIEKVLVRVAALQEVVREMNKLATDVSGAESEGDVQMIIRAVGKEMTSRRRKLEGSHTRQVSQQHMEAGSIELF